MNIFVYGCSFSTVVNDQFLGWTQLLANKLGARLFNHAISGASSEYAFCRWLQDVKEDKFQSGDLIIFQVSLLGRLFFSHQQEFPSTASSYFPFPGNDYLLDKKKNSWYFENKHHLEWYFMNQDDTVMFNMRQAYKHTVRSFAESHKNIKVVILENGNYTNFYTLPILNTPKNFFEVPVDLNKINENEFAFEGGYVKWTDFTKMDTRVNHLSILNLHRMSELIYDIYKEGNMLESYENYFEKNLFLKPIKNSQDYFEYVDQKLIYNWLPNQK